MQGSTTTRQMEYHSGGGGGELSSTGCQARASINLSSCSTTPNRTTPHRPGSRGASRQGSRQRKEDSSPVRAATSLLRSRPGSDLLVELSSTNAWRGLDVKGMQQPERPRTMQMTRGATTPRRDMDLDQSLTDTTARRAAAPSSAATCPPAAAREAGQHHGMPCLLSAPSTCPPSRGGAQDHRAETAEPRPPPAGMRGAFSWGVGPNAYEVDGRPGTRGGGPCYELDGRPVTRGGTRPPSRMQLGSQTLGQVHLAPIAPPGGLSSSVRLTTPLANVPRGQPPGSRDLKGSPAAAQQLAMSQSFGSQSLRRGAGARQQALGAVEDDIDKLIEGLGDEDVERDVRSLDDLHHYLSTMDQSEGRTTKGSTGAGSSKSRKHNGASRRGGNGNGNGGSRPTSKSEARPVPRSTMQLLDVKEAPAAGRSNLGATIHKERDRSAAPAVSTPRQSPPVPDRSSGAAAPQPLMSQLSEDMRSSGKLSEGVSARVSPAGEATILVRSPEARGLHERQHAQDDRPAISRQHTGLAEDRALLAGLGLPSQSGKAGCKTKRGDLEDIRAMAQDDFKHLKGQVGKQSRQASRPSTPTAMSLPTPPKSSPALTRADSGAEVPGMGRYASFHFS